MKTQERRRIFSFNVNGNAERYFMVFQFILFALTMIYLLYLIFGTINGVASKITQTTTPAELQIIFDKITFLLLVRISVLFAIVFIIDLLLGSFFLHRLTGPLVRINAVLNQIAEGKIPSSDVVLRKGDFPIDVARALSRALRKLSDKR